MRRSTLFLAVGILAGCLFGGAVGVAVGATTVPQIHACITPHTDVLVYSSSGKCATGAKLVTWNTTGLAGRTGATGATGAEGPQGPAGGSGSGGPAGVPFYVGDGGPGGVNAGTATAATLKVPAGSYIVTLAVPGLTNLVATTCYLSSTPTGAFPSDTFVTFTSETTISLDCSSSKTSWTAAQILATLATQLPAVQ